MSVPVKPTIPSFKGALIVTSTATARTPPPPPLNEEHAQYRKMADDFISSIGPYPEGKFKGRGIVIPAGGSGYFALGWIVSNMLRRLGCTLPIQFWYLGNREMNAKMKELVQPLGVVCVDGEVVRKEHPVKLLNGWELKPFSMLWSTFEEVMLIDADNIPLVDPEFLFDTDPYKATGAIFWPDRGRFKPTVSAWEAFNVAYQDEPEQDSGQIVINKKKCWRELNLAMHFNENSVFYYKHNIGDKDICHLSWRRLGTPYSMPARGIQEIPFTMCQHDFQGRRIFQHRGYEKLGMGIENKRSAGFEREDECFELLKMLSQRWDGQI